MSEAVKAQPLILQQIAAAERSRGALFRVQFAVVWAVLIGALVAVLASSNNIDLPWFGEYATFILAGSGITVFVCLASISVAVVFALLGALARLSRSAVVYAVGSLYVSLVRGTPLLVQVFFVYYALADIGVVIDPIPAGILALSFNYGAYMTEIFRAGIQAVPRGQREAAHALGMQERLIMRRIVMPQAIRIVIPAVGNEFIAMIKDSSLVAIIGVQELLWRANTAGTPTLHRLQAFLLAALVYWILTIVFSFFQERMERRLARGDR
ncbi:MAG: amino acid ABC transporter permease [Chloroflexota bacterium]|nr:amino acid ABC transporter permease [Chloroflexota bacterium]